MSDFALDKVQRENNKQKYSYKNNANGMFRNHIAGPPQIPVFDLSHYLFDYLFREHKALVEAYNEICCYKSMNRAEAIPLFVVMVERITRMINRYTGFFQVDVAHLLDKLTLEKEIFFHAHQKVKFSNKDYCLDAAIAFTQMELVISDIEDAIKNKLNIRNNPEPHAAIGKYLGDCYDFISKCRVGDFKGLPCLEPEQNQEQKSPSQSRLRR